jgi:hypothetical protein
VARRRLLKILVAAGSVFTASSVLPAKWIRPIIEVGMLPSHAQASDIPRPLCYTATVTSRTPTVTPTCYTPTATPPTPRCYTPTAASRAQTESSTATPTPAKPQARRHLLDRLLAEGRFPPDIARDL